jgi:rRNA pseudouridine-1189 N-methylase Emg1 (Nep1/Mra1 family)
VTSRLKVCRTTAQALLSILDSPLNKAGKTKAIYVSTTKNVLIQINPQLRIPRTFRRFCGVMGAWRRLHLSAIVRVHLTC